MDETWIVQRGDAAGVLPWLTELAAAARREQTAHALRPQTPVGEAVAIDLLTLPLPVRATAQSAVGIYAQPPALRPPFGRLLLLVLVEQVGPGLRLEIASDPAFALRADEIRWHLRARFGRALCGAGGRRTGLLLAINDPQPGGSGRSGAPVLACNVWLEEQLAALGPGRPGRRRLFRPWLEQYRQLRGFDPVDPLRSFRAAVKGCEQRLQRRQADGC